MDARATNQARLCVNIRNEATRREKDPMVTVIFWARAHRFKLPVLKIWVREPESRRIGRYAHNFDDVELLLLA